MLGPVTVGGVGYKNGYLIFSTLAIVPVVAVVVEEMEWGRRRRREGRREEEEEEEEREEVVDEEGKREEEEEEVEVEEGEDETRAIITSTAERAAPPPPSPTAAAAATTTAPSSPQKQKPTPKPDDKGAPIGWGFRLLLSLFLFLYTGAEVGVGGWIATVLLLQKLTVTKEAAAFVVAIFWGALTVGRFLAVPLALKLRPSKFLFLQLGITLLSALLLIGMEVEGGREGGRAVTVTGVTVGVALYGLGMSSIFPLMMTLPGEMNLHLDMKSTSHFLIGKFENEFLPSLPPSFTFDDDGDVDDESAGRLEFALGQMKRTSHFLIGTFGFPFLPSSLLHSSLPVLILPLSS